MQVKSHSEVGDEVLQGKKEERKKKKEFVMKATLNRTSVPFSFVTLQASSKLLEVKKISRKSCLKKKKILNKENY